MCVGSLVRANQERGILKPEALQHTSRDVHGWAMKLYTDEGNLDWVFNNTVCGH